MSLDQKLEKHYSYLLFDKKIMIFSVFKILYTETEQCVEL